MKVLILGSAPGAEIPEADHAYCANASAYYYAGSLKKISKVDWVVGAHIVAASAESNADKNLKKLASYLKQSSISTLTVLDHKPWFSGWDLPASLLRVKRETKVVPQVVSFVRRREILFNTAGLREPIISRHLFSEINSPRMVLRGAKLLFGALTLTQKMNENSEANPALRPSTGLWAAMIAMEKYGSGVEYIISGISLKAKADRIQHPHGLRFEKLSGFTHHLHADRKIMEKLKENYSIRYIHPGKK